jgi:4-diphosphocytidyl-2-C-methyl-D-erythritol kinase
LIELHAPAKLTWYLEITGLREDGYHLIRGEMVSLDYADRLLVDESEDYLRLTSPREDVPLDERNLVARALKLVNRSAGVTIDKVIPSGGGLGGGSSDAAAILRWSGGVSPEEALTLGGDVPFCQFGGRSLVEGVGELLTPLPFRSRKVTLIMPNFAVKTADCYGAYDELIDRGWRPKDDRNHLERAAKLVEPRLARTLAWVRAEIGEDVHLAGSGSSMFVIGEVMVPGGEMTGPEGPLQFRQAVTTPAQA